MSQQQQPGDPPTVVKPIEPEKNPHSSDYALYPKLQPEDVALHQSETWSSVPIASQHQSPLDPPATSQASAPHVEERAPIVGDAATLMPLESNPYVAATVPPPASSVKNKMDLVKNVPGKWGKKAAEATKKSQDLAGSVWQHWVLVLLMLLWEE